LLFFFFAIINHPRCDAKTLFQSIPTHIDFGESEEELCQAAKEMDKDEM